MSLTQWVFCRTADGSFESVAMAAYGRFQAGGARLTRTGCTELVVAELVVELDERTPVAVRSVTFRCFPVLANGVRDPHAVRQERDLFEVLASEAGAQPSPAGHFARLQLENRFRGSPSRADWDALAEAVNRRAKLALFSPKLRLQQP